MNESALFQKLNKDLTEALKNRDTEVLRVLRFSKASLAAAEKEQGTYLSDADFVKIIGKKIKQSQDSISQFKKGSRTDLVAAEEQEIAILSRYMPQPLVEAELSKIVEEVIVETSAESIKDIGRVMGAAMKKVSGRADGTVVKKLVEEKLKAM